MKNLNLFSYATILLLFLNIKAYSQQDPTLTSVAVAETIKPVIETTAKEEEVKPEEKPKVTLSGYIDSYYLYAFNKPKSGTLMGSPSINGGYPVGRAFDRMDNQFSLGLFQSLWTFHLTIAQIHMAYQMF